MGHSYLSCSYSVHYRLFKPSNTSRRSRLLLSTLHGTAAGAAVVQKMYAKLSRADFLLRMRIKTNLGLRPVTRSSLRSRPGTANKKMALQGKPYRGTPVPFVHSTSLSLTEPYSNPIAPPDHDPPRGLVAGRIILSTFLITSVHSLSLTLHRSAKLSNDDFRRLMMTPRPSASADRNVADKKLAENSDDNKNMYRSKLIIVINC